MEKDKSGITTMKHAKKITILIISFLFFSSMISISESTIKKNDSQKYDDILTISLTQNFDFTTFISIDLDVIDKNESTIIVYASDTQKETLDQYGFQSTILYNDFYEMMGWDEHPERVKSFHDYDQMTTELQIIASTYPNITNLYELGQSVQGRTIWGLKITDNPDIEENEIELRYCGAHHGNEYMSVELPLLFAWDLVQNYSIDPDITDYIDNREIWIMPMVNPDGREMGQRRNANNVDLNRDYGYMWNGAGSSPSPFSQPETQTIREHALDNNIVLSYSYHTTAEYVNYIWNYKPQPTPDEPWIIMISNVYGDLSGYQPINGFDWYQTTGDTNDFSYGCYGGIDTTIETLNSNIQIEWNRNRDAMYYTLDVADMGLSGIVTDVITGDPLEATIWVEENYWPCYTDPKVGDYHKPLFEGSYHVHFRANGYEEQIKTITITDANASNTLNAALNPGDEYYTYQITMCEYFNYNTNPTEGISALGPPDNIPASLGNNGMMVLDMGNTSEIVNGVGDDFTVYEADEDAEGYQVSVSNNWNGPWSSLGAGFGTSSFDLEDVGLETARFVKIEDDGVTSNTKDYPGFDLDAIEALNLSSSNEVPIANFAYWPSNPTTNDRLYFTDTSFDTDGFIATWNWDFGDGNGSSQQHPSHQYSTPGNYLVSLSVTDDDGATDATSQIIHVDNYGPNADFTFTPLHPEVNEIISFMDASYDTSGDSIVSWFWEFDDGDTSTLQHPTHVYHANGSYQVNLTVTNTTGALYTISKPVYVGMISVDIPLNQGWNLITVPVETDWYASDLAENITGCEMISWFDSENQTYKTHIVGVPGYDFEIHGGYGLFVLVDQSSLFSVYGPPIFDVSVPLSIGWNMIGWFHNYTTTASSLVGNISDCEMVSWFDAENQTFKTHIAGVPGYDFTITQSMGLFLYTNEASVWHGEG